MTYSLFYVISCVCLVHWYALVAVLDCGIVGATWERLTLLRDAWGLTGQNDVWCKSKGRHSKLSRRWVLNLLSRLVVHEVPSSFERWRLCTFVFINQQNSHDELWTKKSPELMYIYPFCPVAPPFSFPPTLYTPTASWSWHHVTCTKHRLLFQNTPDNLHIFVVSLWNSVSYNCIIMLTIGM